MTTIVLDKLVSQNTPLPNLWKYVLGYVNSNSVPMKSLSNIFSRYLINSEISLVSEIEKLQIALQVCSFYTELNNEEIAQNIITLLLDSGAKHQECLEFLAFLTSVAASSKCALYLQTFGILVSQENVIQFVCQRIITDNCVDSQCYPELYSIAKMAPQFTLHLLKHTLRHVVQAISDETSSTDKEQLPSLVDLCMNLVDQNETFFLQSDVLHWTLFCIILLPLFNKSKVSKEKRIKMRNTYEKLFKTIFFKLSAGEAKVEWEALRKISNLIKQYEVGYKVSSDGKQDFGRKSIANASRDCLNQIILVTSHEKSSLGEQGNIASLIQKTEFGEFLLQSLPTS